jgi:hypothetical protein
LKFRLLPGSIILCCGSVPDSEHPKWIMKNEQVTNIKIIFLYILKLSLNSNLHLSSTNLKTPTFFKSLKIYTTKL